MAELRLQRLGRLLLPVEFLQERSTFIVVVSQLFKAGSPLFVRVAQIIILSWVNFVPRPNFTPESFIIESR